MNVKPYWKDRRRALQPQKYNAEDYIDIYIDFLHKKITQKQAMEIIACFCVISLCMNIKYMKI